MNRVFNRRKAIATSIALSLATQVPPRASAQTISTANVIDETWRDMRRKRDVPVRIRWPQALAPVDGWPVVIYSHGLGGSREGGDVWGSAWAAAGFVVLHLQHAGSDIDAVRGVAISFRDQAALRGLGTGKQLLNRLEDVVFVIDEMVRRKNDATAIDKAWRFVQLDALGMAGHSFGALTTLGVGGQSYPNHPGIKELRIKALMPLSASVPSRGDAVQAYAAITRPTLCITGTLDGDVMGNGATPDKRAAVFGALPAGNKAMLLLKDADHMSFGGVTGRAAGVLQREAVSTEWQPQHHALVAAITTDWWRAHLLGDAAARARLVKPQGVVAPDTWQVG